MHWSLYVERWAPTFLSIVGAAAWWWWDCSINESYQKELLSALLSAAAVCAGFLTTALTILLSLGSTRTGKKLKSKGYWPGIHGYLRHAIYGSLFLSLVCVVIFFMLPRYEQWWSPVLVGATCFAATTLVRIAEVLLNVMERMSADD